MAGKPLRLSNDTQGEIILLPSISSQRQLVYFSRSSQPFFATLNSEYAACETKFIFLKMGKNYGWVESSL